MTSRLKIYTAQSGYVYQYRLVRKDRTGSGYPGTEFVFDVSSDRKTSVAITVIVADEGVAGWAAERGRELADPEIHAAAKLRLWQALDEVTPIREGPNVFRVDSSNIVSLLDEIGVN